MANGILALFLCGNIPAPLVPDSTFSQDATDKLLDPAADIRIDVREYNTCDGRPRPSEQLACWVTFEQYGLQK